MSQVNSEENKKISSQLKIMKITPLAICEIKKKKKSSCAFLLLTYASPPVEGEQGIKRTLTWD